MTYRPALVERLFRYLAIESQSDPRSSTLPSSPGQLVLARRLADELRGLGVEDVIQDDQAIVTGVKRGTLAGAPKIGFIAHLDTVDVGLSASIRPQILHFDGSDLCLNEKQDIWLRVAEHPEIQRWCGHDIIFGDGTSVLGADNKAAIAVIMTLIEILSDGIPRGDIFVAFVPDEEIGLRGAAALDLSRFACDFAYTIDCCELGEFVLENFNAAYAELVFNGVSTHPMSAKGVLVNPLLMAMDFIAHFDRCDTPECTDGRQGFFWFKDMQASDSQARLTVLIRDFDADRFEARKAKIKTVTRQMSEAGIGSIECRLVDNYMNIGPYLAADCRPASLLLQAFDTLGIVPKPIAMRGGTDGAVLSVRGIPTPNFFTGAHNFHSRFEFLPIHSFEKSLEVALAIAMGAQRQIGQPRSASLQIGP